MSLQADGLAEVLRGGAFRVSGPSGSATAPLDLPVVDGSAVLLRAVFGPDTANFEWLRREVLTATGVVLDQVEEDMGRKVQPMTWTVETRLAVGPE